MGARDFSSHVSVSEHCCNATVLQSAQIRRGGPHRLSNGHDNWHWQEILSR